MTCEPTIMVRWVSEDELPQLDFEFEGEDISSYVSIKLRLRFQSGILLERDAVVDDAPNGEFHFEFAANEIPAGSHQMEVVFEPVADKHETWPAEAPILLEVRRRA